MIVNNGNNGYVANKHGKTQQQTQNVQIITCSNIWDSFQDVLRSVSENCGPAGNGFFYTME